MYGRLGLKQSLSRSSHSTSRASVADCAVLGDVLSVWPAAVLLLLVLPPSSVLPPLAPQKRSYTPTVPGWGHPQVLRVRVRVRVQHCACLAGWGLLHRQGSYLMPCCRLMPCCVRVTFVAFWLPVERG